MAARITIDIFCDNCGTWEHGVTDDVMKTREARRAVKKFGWGVRRDADGKYRDLCPDCLAEEKEQQ